MAIFKIILKYDVQGFEFIYDIAKGKDMAVRILLLIIAFAIAVNLVILGVGLINGVNLYKAYGKQILAFFAAFGLFVICAYVVMAIIGLV